jgi:hypothetical protein
VLAIGSPTYYRFYVDYVSDGFLFDSMRDRARQLGESEDLKQ